jgi:pimeloyl-ACP methyl ester carboxylesterase
MSCATPTLLGREVLVAEHPLRVAGLQLSYFEAVPAGLEGARLPLVVFVEGDGSRCQRFSERGWRRFLTRNTGRFVMVRPRTEVNTVCESETTAFERARFLSRLDELEALLDDLERRHPGRPVVLLGQSAGAHLSVLLASRAPARVAALINLSGGVDDLREVIAELTPPARQESLAQLARGLEAGERLDEPMWGRTRWFWREMFFSGASAAWRAWTGRCWLAHGTRDGSVPASLVHRSLGGTRCEAHFLEGAGHDVLDAALMRELDAWVGQL